MTIDQALTAISATAGVFSVIVVIYIAHGEARRNQKIDTVQKELTELQIATLKDASIVINFKAEHITHYRLDYSSGSTKPNSIPESIINNFLVIKNTGSGEARDIKIEFESDREDYNTPHCLVEPFEIDVLAPGTEMTFGVPMAMDDSPFVKGTWKWEDISKNEVTRVSKFIIPG